MRLYRPWFFLTLAVFFSACHTKKTFEESTTTATASVATNHWQGSIITKAVSVTGQFRPVGDAPVFLPDSGTNAVLTVTRTDYQHADTARTQAAAAITRHAHWESDRSQHPNACQDMKFFLYIGLVLVIVILAVRLLRKPFF